MSLRVEQRARGRRDPHRRCDNSAAAARPGERVRVEGVTSDPDGNAVTVKWWRWKDVDTYPGNVALANPTSLSTSLRVPADAVEGQTMQFVLEATAAFMGRQPCRVSRNSWRVTVTHRTGESWRAMRSLSYDSKLRDK